MVLPPVGLVALSGCTISRPASFEGGVEIVRASAQPRGFPTRVSEGLGICLKMGGAHDVRSDGVPLTYPADSICIRLPGCVWSSEVASVGFVSLEIAESLLPRGMRRSPMRFMPASELPGVRELASRLEGDASPLALQGILTELLAFLHARGALAAAELDGDEPSGTALRKARDFLAATLSQNASLDALAAATGTNKFVLIRHFRRKLGTTPHSYLLSLRIERARAMLARGEDLAEVALAVGFADQGHFSRHFKRVVGMSPGRYLRSVRASVAVSPTSQFRSRRARPTGR